MFQPNPDTRTTGQNMRVRQIALKNKETDTRTSRTGDIAPIIIFSFLKTDKKIKKNKYPYPPMSSLSGCPFPYFSIEKSGHGNNRHDVRVSGVSHA